MSQFDWDYLEKRKQDIIDRKLVYTFWDFKDLKEIDDTLTDDEMLKILGTFGHVGGCFMEIAHETLEQFAYDVISEREKATV